MGDKNNNSGKNSNKGKLDRSSVKGPFDESCSCQHEIGLLVSSCLLSGDQQKLKERTSFSNKGLHNIAGGKVTLDSSQRQEILDAIQTINAEKLEEQADIALGLSSRE